MCVIIVIFFIFIIFLLLLRCLLLRWLLFKKLVNLLLWTSQKLNSYFAVFEQVNWLFCWLWICQKFNSYLGDFEEVNWLFCYFEHVKNLIFILLTLNKSKIKLTTKLPWENLDGYTFFSFFFFFWPSPHVTGTPPWLLRLVMVSTSSELYPDTWIFVFWMLRHPVF